MIIRRASWTAGKLMSFLGLASKNSPIAVIACSVAIFVYMLTASAMKSLAFGGSGGRLRSFWTSA